MLPTDQALADLKENLTGLEEGYSYNNPTVGGAVDTFFKRAVQGDNGFDPDSLVAVRRAINNQPEKGLTPENLGKHYEAVMLDALNSIVPGGADNVNPDHFWNLLEGVSEDKVTLAMKGALQKYQAYDEAHQKTKDEIAALEQKRLDRKQKYLKDVADKKDTLKQNTAAMKALIEASTQ